MVTDSVALLTGSRTSCVWYFGGNTLALPIETGGNARVSALRRSVFECGLRYP